MKNSQTKSNVQNADRIRAFVLRESLIQLSHAIASRENKGDKMNMLYDYLTSNEFKLQIEAIVEGFTQMHN